MDMSGQAFYAHSLPGRPTEEFEALEKHLREVAAQAAAFAEPFGAADWAHLAGLWHDLGKYSNAFQEYLLSTADGGLHRAELRGTVDHTSAGAQHAAASFPVLGHLLAFAIAGHHAGLHDARSDETCLEARLRKHVQPWGAAPSDLLERGAPALPEFLRRAHRETAPFTFAFFVRMIFSCLVDADYLCTERFVDPSRAASRPSWPGDILDQMAESVVEYVKRLPRHASDSRVNRERDFVFSACLAAAPRNPGMFSLTVPTGGGKTLASLAFALHHSLQFGMRRVVYVLPFTSIIEQNAEVFRDALRSIVAGGLPDPVLEHHSSLSEEHETDLSRLASENWDAPLVVTTAVQFFESLFANRTSRCRKLHRLAAAVIVLDEAQTLPVDRLEPCLRVLGELASNYGATVVLCSATQPAIGAREGFRIGLDGVREIAPDPPNLYRRLRRVEVRDLGRLEDAEVVSRMAAERRVLCIVNTRGHARKLARALGNQGDNFHLSALMCPEHRTARLREIQSRLRETDLPCRVVSTQLVEAGVDLDFPVVLRSLAGVDAIAQAAGRCNRNGRYDQGLIYLFRSEHRRSEVFLSDTANVAEQVLALHQDPLALEAVEHYFKLYYWDQTSRWDAAAILDEYQLSQDRSLPFLFGFARIADRFHLIEDSGRPVIVPWGKEGTRLSRQLQDSGELPPYHLLRRLQRYSVSIPRRQWEAERERAFEFVHDRYAVLVCPELNYSEDYGLVLEGTSGAFLEA